MQNKYRFLPISMTIIGSVIVTGLWGCLLIYASRAFGESPFYFVSRQLFWLLLGCVGFLAIAAAPFRTLFRWRFHYAAFMLIILWLALFFGVERNGMRGWFAITDSILIQPSEFAKSAFLLTAAGFAAVKHITRLQKFWCLCGTAAAFCLPVILEPDFGTTFIFFLGFLIILFLAGGAWREFLPVLCTGAATLVAFLFWKDYSFDRILGFLDPESGIARSSWHLRQFQYTLAHGGITGSEHNAALWSNAYLPLPHSDSLFATIVETSGFIGGLIVITAFCGISYAFIRLSRRANLTPEARIFIAGTALLYLSQALLHISVNVLLLPPTGITLPLLSYGGSSLCSTLLTFGIAASAARDRIRE